MELYFGAMLCSNFGDENSDAGHIKCSCEPQVPHPCLKALRYPACVIWSAHLATCSRHALKKYHWQVEARNDTLGKHVHDGEKIA